MYLVGAPHRHKEDARRLLERHIAAGDRLVTDAEVYQEILHRYVAIRRHDATGPAFAALSGVVDEVLSVDLEAVETARGLLEEHAGLSARDALHVAIMRQHEIGRVMSFDTGFDQVEGIDRIC
jgi:predicted nucleic acid-binding protein